MVSRFYKISVACIFAMLFLTGCGLFSTVEEKPPYQPKPIEAQARAVTVAKNIPYNCKILWEVEGKDSSRGTRGATKTMLREGAINDLRNEAYYVGGQGKRVMVNITKELCKVWNGNNWQSVDCNALQGNALSYRIHAQVFDCGDR